MAPEPRLAAHVWVGAYLRRLSAQAIPAYVLRHGDETAGEVLVKCASLDGRARLWRREWDFATDTRPWTAILDGTEAEIDERLARESSRDPDLWVIEVEARDGSPRLD